MKVGNFKLPSRKTSLRATLCTHNVVYGDYFRNLIKLDDWRSLLWTSYTFHGCFQTVGFYRYLHFIWIEVHNLKKIRIRHANQRLKWACWRPSAWSTSVLQDSTRFWNAEHIQFATRQRVTLADNEPLMALAGTRVGNSSRDNREHFRNFWKPLTILKEQFESHGKLTGF